MENVSSRQRTAEVELNGELTIERAKELQCTLAAAIFSAETVGVRLANGSDFDLSFVQILCSLHRTAAVQGKRVVLHGQLPASLTGLLRKAGLPAEFWAGASDQDRLLQFAA